MTARSNLPARSPSGVTRRTCCWSGRTRPPMACSGTGSNDARALGFGPPRGDPRTGTQARQHRSARPARHRHAPRYPSRDRLPAGPGLRHQGGTGRAHRRARKAPDPVPARVMRAYVYAAVVAAALALLAGGAYRLHSAGFEAGQAACEAAHAAAATKAGTEVERREVASAAASTSMLDYLQANLPPIETRTHAAVERIRTVYRDRPVPAACQWPDRVRQELA